MKLYEFVYLISYLGNCKGKEGRGYSKFEMQSCSDLLCLLHSRKTIFWPVNFFQPRRRYLAPVYFFPPATGQMTFF